MKVSNIIMFSILETLPLTKYTRYLTDIISEYVYYVCFKKLVTLIIKSIKLPL